MKKIACITISSLWYKNRKVVRRQKVMFVAGRGKFSMEEAKKIGGKLGIKWGKFDVDQFRRGLDVELEHGLVSPSTNVTNDDPIMTGKIALAHLNEFADYYDRLGKMEKEADRFWGKED